MTRRNLQKAFGRLDALKKTRDPEVPGILGFTVNGINTVEVGNRSGFVWVRLRNNANEVIQAFNDQVSPVYGLPVVVIRDENDRVRYKIKGKDLGVYQNWNNTPYLPRHGNQHSFNPEGGGGGDVVFVYNRQFMPLAVHPSGSAGGGNVYVQPYAYYQGTTWKYAGGTGTASFLPYKPTGSNARMVLVYLDEAGNPQLSGGSLYFDASITGNAAVLPYVPSLGGSSDIPLAAVRLVSGTNNLVWDNIYDLRPIIVSDGFIPTGSSGHTIQDDGVPLASQPALNFVGSNFSVYNTAGVTNVSGSFVSGGGGGISERSLPIQDSSVFVITGTAISFDGDLQATAVGSVAHVTIPAGTFSSGTHTHPASSNDLLIYDDHVFKVTGTALDFTDNIAVAVTGSVAYISSTATGGGGGSNALPIQDDSVFQVTGTAISFDKDLSVSVVGTVAHIDIPTNTFASGSHTHPVGATAIQIFDNSVFKTTGTAISFDSNLTVVSTGTVAFVSSTGGSGTGSSNHAYYSNLAAWLEPDAFEPILTGTFSYAVASNETKYLMASYWTRLGSAGRFEVRDPRKPMPLRNVTLNGLNATSMAIVCDPTLPTYTDARETYFDRLKQIDELDTKNVDLVAPNTPYLLLPGPYGSIITRSVNFDFTWIVARPRLATNIEGINLANEIGDTGATDYQRNDNALLLPIKKGLIDCVQSGAERSAGVGLGTVSYVILPSTWSKVYDPLSPYDFREDFVGASLDLGVWNRTGTAAGNFSIDTNFQWLKTIGNGNWGENGIFSKTGVSRASGTVFLCDIYLDTTNPSTQTTLMVGLHDGAGYSYTDFSHGILFSASAGPVYDISVFENGISRGNVGNHWTAGSVYRIRITLTGNAAAYAIQGGIEYPAIGSNSWTTITPGTTSSSTTPLYAGASKQGTNTCYISDVRIYT